MKRISLIALLAMFTFVAKAQELKFAPVDASPADIVYFPLNVTKAKDNSTPSIKVVYSRPAKRGVIYLACWSNLARYGVWALMNPQKSNSTSV